MNIMVKALLVLIITSLVVFLSLQFSNPEKGLSVKTDADEYEDNRENQDADERIYIINEHKAVRLDDEVLRLSGIKSELLASITSNPDFTARAEVINIEPLIAARTEYLNLQAEHKVLLVDLNNQHQILKRAEALHKTKSLTTRELEQVRADYELKLSRVNGMKTRLENFSFRLKSEWGAVIGNLVLDPQNAGEFEMLASFGTTIVMVSLLKNQTLTDTQQKVFINTNSQRNTAVPARYLDKARHISNPFYGESHYYYVDMENPGAGLLLYAWIVESGAAVEGLFVPDQAVIWYANEPWIYTRHEENLFVRIPVGTARKVPNGWLLDRSLVNDDLVVVSGSQTLLSEEFKWAIPDEDAD